MNLLHVDSSILGPGSVSRRLSAEIVRGEVQRHPGLAVSYRDLTAQPIAHLTAPVLAAWQGQVPDGSAGQDAADGAQALEAFLAADVVVVGAPMYNFGIPSQLKAWIDRLAVAGRTFRYGPNGPEGLAGGKRVIVASSRGGHYGPGTPAAFLDHQETYLRGLFGFLDIADVTFIRAEGIALGPEHRAEAIRAAETQIAALAA